MGGVRCYPDVLGVVGSLFHTNRQHGGSRAESVLLTTVFVHLLVRGCRMEHKRFFEKGTYTDKTIPGLVSIVFAILLRKINFHIKTIV